MNTPPFIDQNGYIFGKINLIDLSIVLFISIKISNLFKYINIAFLIKKIFK